MTRLEKQAIPQWIYEAIPPPSYEVVWHGGMRDPVTPRAALVVVPLPDENPVADRILAVLARGPLTVKQIQATIRMSHTRIYTVCQQLVTSGRLTVEQLPAPKRERGRPTRQYRVNPPKGAA